MEKLHVMRALFDNKILNVLDIFFKNRESQFFLKELSAQSKVSLTSCYRIIRRLVSVKVLKEVKVSRFVVYQLNDSEETRFLEEVVIEQKNYVDEFVRNVKIIPGIKQIILHGVETKDKANILIIGNKLDPTLFKPIIADFKLNKNYNISALTLDPDQYTQMTDMGLYSGKKRILFEKN
ncbi:MAG: hypothetical protein WC755_03250 [Candidatus Woesearchaeota archaeon]|jgi:Fe2+ or Zn2+ uptake regulation protein